MDELSAPVAPATVAPRPARATVAAARVGWPLGAALALLAVVLARTYTSATEATGAFAYALDDAYIHMAIAKNLAADGVWGVTRHAFTSASSSPLWTALLAGLYAVVGVRHDVSLWTNVVFAAALLVAAFAAVRRELPALAALALLAGLVLLVPLAPIVFGGMEHVLHTTLAIVFVALAADAVAADVPRRRGWLVAAALLATAVRFESGFLVAPVCAMLVLRRRLILAVTVGAAAALPVVLLGALNLANGWPFLPLSILLKVDGGSGLSLGVLGRLSRLAAAGLGAPHVAWLLGCAAALLVAGLLRGRALRDPRQVALAVIVVAGALHLAFAGLGWLYRYEAYLLAAGLVALARSARDLVGAIRRPALAGAALALALAATALPLPMRALAAHEDTRYAIRNIHEQQVQMATFLASFYPDASVAANDIGAINWFADLRLLDTFGLASREVAAAKLSRSFSGETIETLAAAAGVEIAAVYPEWLPGVPRSWRPAGFWRIRENRVCGSDIVVFFAVAPAADERLRRSLAAFAPVLPRSVEWGLLGR